MSQGELTTFLCLFHQQDHAESAIKALESAGFSRNTITSVGGREHASEAASVRGELQEVGVPSRDLQHLEDGIADGGVVVSLEAAEERTDEIEAIFHRYSAGKIDEVDPAPAILAAPLAAAASPAMREDEVVVPVVAEALVVGKREVERGGVRVFRRTVEEPVSEQVSLHSEHITMDRRPVDRAVTEGDLRAGDQTIELIETDEVPVVAKVSRVVEEVHLGVVGTDRTETVTDNIRHTEVDVEPVEDEPADEVLRTSKTTGSNPVY